MTNLSPAKGNRFAHLFTFVIQIEFSFEGNNTGVVNLVAVKVAFLLDSEPVLFLAFPDSIVGWAEDRFGALGPWSVRRTRPSKTDLIFDAYVVGRLYRLITQVIHPVMLHDLSRENGSVVVSSLFTTRHGQPFLFPSPTVDGGGVPNVAAIPRKHFVIFNIAAKALALAGAT